MEIHVENIGRRYNREWIFRSFSYIFQSVDRHVILGPNGSGKSTLLKILSGHLSVSEGSINYRSENAEIDIEEVYSKLTIAAPYIDLIEDFTLEEMISFHFKFKQYYPGYDTQKIIDYLEMSGSANKELKYFSSGMKQRVKLALACFSHSQLLILDEPTSNLDDQGVEWYKSLIINTVDPSRILILGSNQPHEYEFCNKKIYIQEYKHL